MWNRWWGDVSHGQGSPRKGVSPTANTRDTRERMIVCNTNMSLTMEDIWSHTTEWARWQRQEDEPLKTPGGRGTHKGQEDSIKEAAQTRWRTYLGPSSNTMTLRTKKDYYTYWLTSLCTPHSQRLSFNSFDPLSIPTCTRPSLPLQWLEGWWWGDIPGGVETGSL